MIVYFHIDELGRDAVVASALRKEGTTRGWRVVYGNRRSSVLLQHLNVFDAIVLPSLLHFKWYFPDTEALPDNVFILPTEAVGQATGHLRRINAKYFGTDDAQDAPWHRAVRGFLLWGYAHLSPFQEFHPEYLDRCRVVGHPRLSKLCVGPRRAKRCDKKTVGFISRFGKLNCFDRRGNMSLIFDGMKDADLIQATYENSPEMDIEDMIYTEALDLRVMFLVMKGLSTSEYDFVIKPHPREDAAQWSRFIEKYRIRAKVYKWDAPFASWLGEVDYIIGPPSTSFYDVLAQGRRPICTDKIVAKRANHVLTESDDNNQILRYVYRPDSLDELLESIREDRVPDVASGFKEVLEGQTAPSIAADSLANIFGALDEMTRPGKSRGDSSKGRLALAGYWTATLARAYAAKARDAAMRVDEQGASFYLTIGRAFWIDALSDAVTAGFDGGRG